MTEHPLTLNELAERSGVEARTLRSWIQQGLLPGPDSAGRNARYAPGALIRARAIKAMRDIHGLTLAAIRQDLLTADDGRIASFAALGSPEPEQPGFNEGGEVYFSPGPMRSAAASAPAPGGSTAAEYLRGLRNTGVLTATPVQSAAHPALASRSEADQGVAGQPRPASRFAHLIEALERIAGGRPSGRKTRGHVRLHIPVTPEVELTVRGDLEAEDIARFEQLADLLRIILTGGSTHD